MSLESIQGINGNLQSLDALNNLTGALSFESPEATNNIFVEKLLMVDSTIKSANSMAERYINGEDIPVHDLVISMGKAKTELQLIVDVRNRLLDAYQEISKIQL